MHQSCVLTFMKGLPDVKVRPGLQILWGKVAVQVLQHWWRGKGSSLLSRWESRRFGGYRISQNIIPGAERGYVTMGTLMVASLGRKFPSLRQTVPSRTSFFPLGLLRTIS